VAPDGEGETLGFRDARLERISEQRELNFVLAPFMSHQVPSSMKVNAAELLRKALQDSTATSGYKVTLERLKIHSIQIQGDSVIVDVDGDLSVK
jgi:glycine cleavage system regulatory protein